MFNSPLVLLGERYGVDENGNQRKMYDVFCKEIDKHLYNISLVWGAPLSTEQKLTRVIDIMIEEMSVVLDRRIVPNL